MGGSGGGLGSFRVENDDSDYARRPGSLMMRFVIFFFFADVLRLDHVSSLVCDVEFSFEAMMGGIVFATGLCIL